MFAAALCWLSALDAQFIVVYFARTTLRDVGLERFLCIYDSVWVPLVQLFSRL